MTGGVVIDGDAVGPGLIGGLRCTAEGSTVDLEVLASVDEEVDGFF